MFSDDLDISPDFFDYFLATYPVLHTDPSLWCVSAWNDNGKADLVSDESGLSSLYLFTALTYVWIYFLLIFEKWNFVSGCIYCVNL